MKISVVRPSRALDAISPKRFWTTFDDRLADSNAPAAYLVEGALLPGTNVRTYTEFGLETSISTVEGIDVRIRLDTGGDWSQEYLSVVSPVDESRIDQIAKFLYNTNRIDTFGKYDMPMWEYENMECKNKWRNRAENLLKIIDEETQP